MSLSNLRFLVIDDHETSLQIVQTLLRGMGARVVTAVNTVAQGLELVDAGKVDVAIVDYLLESEEGLAFVKAIRCDQSPNPFLPIVILTAHTEQWRVEAVRDAGANAFCAKPISALELFRKVRAAVEDNRPFVRTDIYFGPDRRRKDDPAFLSEDRREPRPDMSIATALKAAAG